MRELTVKHTQDRHGNPLAVVRDFPGLDAELTPAELRSLAFALFTAADNCEIFHRNGKLNGIPNPAPYKWGAQ